MNDISEIIDYWFGPLDQDGFSTDEAKQKWWSGTDEIDLEISHRFERLIQAAFKHELDDWKETGLGQLALIILLDQFTRNIYRGTEQAFSGDHHALEICKQGLSRKLDLELPIEHRVFFYMPLEHSEDLEDQELCIRLLTALKRESPESKQQLINNYVSFAQQHKEIIEQFGRFPHRNAALNRTNTTDEAIYLEDEHASFGQ